MTAKAFLTARIDGRDLQVPIPEARDERQARAFWPAARHSLTLLSGQDLGLDAGAWRQWWPLQAARN